MFTFNRFLRFDADLLELGFNNSFWVPVDPVYNENLLLRTTDWRGILDGWREFFGGHINSSSCYIRLVKCVLRLAKPDAEVAHHSP